MIMKKKKKWLRAAFISVCLLIVMARAFNNYMKVDEHEETNNEETQAKASAQKDTGLPVLVPDEEVFIADFESAKRMTTLEQLGKYIYSIDETAYMMESDVNVREFLEKDFRLDLTETKPKILIFHTHSQEDFIDSRPGETADTIVGVGNHLAEILVNDYGIPVVHDVGQYDYRDGQVVRSGSYQVMEPAVKKILEKYPSIEIMIDLHRDGVPDNVRLVTEIEGRPTAKIMFFNGITRLNDNGVPLDMPELENPYLRDNLALSLQLFLTSNELYPTLARKIYIRPYRYSLHLKPRSMLVEVGANTNTVEEAKNAMIPLADILVTVLKAY